MFASKHTSMNKTGAGMALRASELSLVEQENASYDMSDAAKAQREAARLQAIADEEARKAAAEAALLLPPGDASSSGIEKKMLIPYREPDGANPHETWAGERELSLGDSSIHYTDNAHIREKYVKYPPALDRFECVEKLAIAPGTFAIDVENGKGNAEAVKDIQEEMNLVMKAPSLANIYDVDRVKDAPRFWAAWPGKLLAPPRNEQLTRSQLRFSIPLSDAATVLDWHSLLCHIGGEGKSLPLQQEPGSIQDTGVIKFDDPSVPYKERTYHSVPVAIKIVKATNTSGVALDVELQVPNMHGHGPLHVSHSEPTGVCSTKRTMFASAAGDCIYNLRASGHFNSPEARRWASLDRELELKKFLVDEDGNETMPPNKAGETVVQVLLTPTPKNMLQFMVTSYASQLYTAAVNQGVSRPFVNQSGIKGDNKFGHVAVVLDTVVEVFNYFCDLYCPSIYAVNQHQWQLSVKPSNAATNMATVFKTIGLRDVAQANVQGAQLEYVIEVFQLPYDGVQRCTPEQKALLTAIDKEYARIVACGAKVNCAHGTGTCPPPQQQLASTPADVRSAIKPMPATPTSRPVYPPSRGASSSKLF